MKRLLLLASLLVAPALLIAQGVSVDTSKIVRPGHPD